jgi:hypothetical protein
MSVSINNMQYIFYYNSYYNSYSGSLGSRANLKNIQRIIRPKKRYQNLTKEKKKWLVIMKKNFLKKIKNIIQTNLHSERYHQNLKKRKGLFPTKKKLN